MGKAKVQLHRICAMDNTGRAPFMEALRRALKCDQPARTLYWLGKIARVLDAEFADYDAARMALVSKYGVNKDGTTWQIPTEKLAEFTAEMKSLERDLELPVEDNCKLALPPTVNGEVWLPLVLEMDVFEEPAA